MTTCIIHGDPGSRKTATLVGNYGVPALYEGRVVVTNIRGFNSLEKVEEAYNKPLPKGAKLLSVPFTREGFRQMAIFYHWAPKGALILMDEGQRIYPTRLKSLSYFDASEPRPVGFIDPHTGEEETISTVEEAFDCHRHMNWDIYISTTNIAKIHKEIRQVAEFGYRQKDLLGVLPFLTFILGDIKRVKHNAEDSGTSQSGAIESTSHRIDKRVFRVYQSTATGKAKNTLAKTSIFSQPKLLIFIGILCVTLFNLFSTVAKYGTLFPDSGTIAEYNRKQAEIAILEINADSQAQPNLVLEENSAPATASDHSNVYLRSDNSDYVTKLIASLYSYDGIITRGNQKILLFTARMGDRLFPITSLDFPTSKILFFGFDRYAMITYQDIPTYVYSVRYPSDPEPSSQPNQVATAL